VTARSTGDSGDSSLITWITRGASDGAVFARITNAPGKNGSAACASGSNMISGGGASGPSSSVLFTTPTTVLHSSSIPIADSTFAALEASLAAEREPFVLEEAEAALDRVRSKGK
jgi:hypothetical protein